MPIVEDTTIYPQMLVLVDCLCEAIKKRGWTKICWCSVVAGEDIPWDVGGDCGEAQGWVRLAGITNTSDNPTCGPTLQYNLEVGIAFVVEAVIGERGELPGPDEMLRDTIKQTSSMRALYDAICCWADDNDGVDVIIGSYASIGPLGGAMGSILQVQVELNG